MSPGPVLSEPLTRAVLCGHLFSDVLTDRHGAPRSSLPGLRVHHSTIALMGRDPGTLGETVPLPAEAMS